MELEERVSMHMDGMEWMMGGMGLLSILLLVLLILGIAALVKYLVYRKWSAKERVIEGALIAYLQAASTSSNQAQGEDGNGMTGGRMGGMSGTAQSLKDIAPNQQVTAISYCGDTYSVTMKTGEVHQFWERNLRFKTDSSATGPLKGSQPWSQRA